MKHQCQRTVSLGYLQLQIHFDVKVKIVMKILSIDLWKSVMTQGACEKGKHARKYLPLTKLAWEGKSLLPYATGVYLLTGFWYDFEDLKISLIWDSYHAHYLSVLFGYLTLVYLWLVMMSYTAVVCAGGDIVPRPEHIIVSIGSLLYGNQYCIQFLSLLMSPLLSLVLRDWSSVGAVG